MVAATTARGVRAVRAGFADRPPAERLAYAAGAVMVAVGLTHLGWWLVVGGPWDGAVSLRKPFAFGVSFGVTTATLGWVAGRLRVNRRLGGVAVVAMVVANLYEVGWVTVQRARGVPSHFAPEGPDAVAFALGGVAIAVTVAVVVWLALVAFRRDGGDPLVLAFRAGLLILLVGSAVGGWMIQAGNAAAIDGVAPTSTIAPGGLMKIPHAVGLHGIQTLPVLALLARRGLPPVAARRWVGVGSAGYTLLTAASILQTAAGRAPGEPGAAVAGLALVGLLLLAAAFVAALLRRGRAPSSPDAIPARSGSTPA